MTAELLPAGGRQALIAQLRANMPEAMTSLKQWLLWRLETVEGRNGLQKIPYYLNGVKRRGELGGEKDRSQLATFERALERLGNLDSMTGLGFAFLEGDGLVGIDLDHVEDDDGVMADRFASILEACPSYTERSPSGRGLHVIAAGACESFKDDGVGVEVYCGGRYFTCTGHRLAGTPDQVKPLKPFALAYLKDLVQTSKDAQRAARAQAASAPAADAQPAHEAALSRTVGPGQAGDDFKRVNDAAYVALHAWVPTVFAKARPYGDGYRVRSKDMGRDLEEDLQLKPGGIYDFGERCGMSPIDVVMKWGGTGSTPKAAMLWLASALGLDVQSKRPRLRSVAAGPGLDQPHDSAAPNARGTPPPAEAKEGGRPRGDRGTKGAGAETSTGGVVQRLLEHYALVRGTDQVWDGEMRTTIAVKNLRLLYGSPFVNLWLGHPERRLLVPEQIKFEPGVDLPPDCVNLFDGLPTAPVPCTEAEVAPMLDLLRHLCSLSAPTKEGVREVYLQVLRWCALIVQRPGAKVRFALVFHGPQGTGKNLYWDGFRRILGKYGKMVGQTELEDRFNGYMSGKLLLIGNEVVTRAELFHNKNKLKWVITEDEIPIRGMHQEVRWESNHANVVFLSNELQPVALEKDDRRHLVIYTPEAEHPDLYLRVAEFLRQDGCGKFLHYLQSVDLEGFNEFSKPLMTGAKEALIDLGLKPAERFANDWLRGFLDLPLHPCSNGQLYKVFRRWCDLEGERYPPPQATFTKTVERHVFEQRETDQDGKRLLPALLYKQIGLKHEAGPRKTVRCWVPRGTGPVNGLSEGEWAAECIDAFEAKVSAFGRAHRAEEDR